MLFSCSELNDDFIARKHGKFRVVNIFYTLSYATSISLSMLFLNVFCLNSFYLPKNIDLIFISVA